MPIRQTLLHSASSLCTIASGGSIGREGPMMQLAALCASLVGRSARFDPARLRLLAACGAAAGIASAYNAMSGRFPVKCLYVVDDDESYRGVVALHDVATLPLHAPEAHVARGVVRSEADPLLLGVAYKTALLDAYARLQPG